MTIKLGLIGLSPGNGHPFSWAAIINNYERNLMRECGFPAIPRYLDDQSWPDAMLDNAVVTHVWTQDPRLSRQIAATCYIDCVAKDFRDMVGEVDAVLLARDDAASHATFAAPFLTSGIPVFVDKPVALTLKSLKDLYRLETGTGRLFSCSALRYSKDLEFTSAELESVMNPVRIRAVAPKDWEKYSIHALEPSLKLVARSDIITGWCAKTFPSKGPVAARSLEVKWESGVVMEVLTSGETDTPISVEVVGGESKVKRTFGDPFQSFKSALEAFVMSVQDGTVMKLEDKVLNATLVKLIEIGMRP